MTKIFCDIADIKQIKKFNNKRTVKGFTTNPSLIRKAGARNYSKYCKNILKITNKPISFEVFADDKKKIIEQANIIKKWGKNVYVKIPVTNSKGIFLGDVIKKLNSKNIKLNITAVYTAAQTKKILTSKVSEKDRKIGHRRINEEGEVSYKKIQSNQLIASIQLGIQVRYSTNTKPLSVIKLPFPGNTPK